MDAAPAIGLDRLLTERADPRFAAIDEMGTYELALLMNEEDAAVPLAVRGQLPQVCGAVDAIVERMSRGGRLRYVGAGTPGRLGVVDASECPPTFGTPRDLVAGLIAGGVRAFTESVEGAEDDTEAGRDTIAADDIGPLDSVVAVSASGRTPFVLAAATEARRRGALTVGVSCNEDTPLSALVEHPVEIPVGPEIVAGSTRLKAGTAQKMVLNMISTITMVRLGHTYQNRLVDMLVVNEKLHARGVRMVSELAAVEEAAAGRALDETGGQIKTAVLMLRRQLDAETARSRLADHAGRLREALHDGRAAGSDVDAAAVDGHG